jgi:hypothetical protein
MKRRNALWIMFLIFVVLDNPQPVQRQVTPYR